MRLDMNQWWATRSPYKGFFPSCSIAYTRVDAIRKTLNMNPRKTWRQLYRQGWRAVRIEIKELQS